MKINLGHFSVSILIGWKTENDNKCANLIFATNYHQGVMSLLLLGRRTGSSVLT